MPVQIITKEDSNEINTASKRARLSLFKDKVKHKTKQALHIDSSDEDGEPSQYQDAMQELNDSPAFNSSKFLNQARIGPAGIPDKTIAFLQGTAELLAHPKSTLKAKATKKTAGKLAKSRPYIARQADLDFLEAHDELQRAEDSACNSDNEEAVARKGYNIGEAEGQVEAMERNRQAMRVAWVSARHVQRVRAINTIAPPPFPGNSFFEEEDDCGFVKFNWGKWIGYKLLEGSHDFTAQYIDDFEEVPFDSDTLRRHIERFIIVSAPLQTFLSDLRCVYRWEDPYRTGRWMAMYFFLWYLGHMMTFLYAQSIYYAVMNYYYPTSLENLREGIARTIDRGATAFKIGELMDKHGSKDWLGPLLEEIGPQIQIQFVDLISLLEASYNFQNFQSPRASFATLCLFFSLFLINLTVSAAFALRFFWFIIGLMFFVCWPISSLYPRYRLLVSPFKWALWEVPNHAEWCFQYLQERASIVKAKIIASAAEKTENTHRTGRKFSPGISSNANMPTIQRYTFLDEEDYNDASSLHSFTTASSTLTSQSSLGTPEQEFIILKFACTYVHTPGHLILTTKSLKFVSTPTSKLHLPFESFDYPYISLVEMSKRQTRSTILNPIAKITTGMDKLELWFRTPEEKWIRAEDGERIIESDSPRGEVHCDRIKAGRGERKVLLENMRGRDKAFNAIIGFSGIRWQHLQREGEKKVPIPGA